MGARNEEASLAVLRSLEILDTGADPRFDRITQLAAEIFEASGAFVSFVDRDRVWFKSTRGIDIRQTARRGSFCTHAVAQKDVLVVPDATLDTRFVTGSLVTAETHVRFYAGAVICASGMPIGTLAIIDRRPRQLDRDRRQHLQMLAGLVEDEVQHHSSITRARAA